MTIQRSSFLPLAGRASRRRVHFWVAPALAVGVAACSSGDDAGGVALPAQPAATPDPSGASAPAGVPSADVPSVPSGAPASSSSEGQQVTELDVPAGEAAPAGADPAAPPPAEGATGDAGTPAAAAPGAPVPSAGCGQARTLQDGLQTISSGGVVRSYHLETPDAYDNTRPHRVVFMFHWNYGSIEAIVNPPDADQNTDRPYYGMGDLDDDQTIYVVPQGLVNPGGGAGWANPNDRDVVFTDDVLAAVSADLCLDESRVFTTGFSYGAGMSVALACVRPDKFRAAVVYAPAFISGVTPDQCTTPIPFFESHGVDDPIINYQTGLNVLNTFTSLNGCTAMTPPEPAADAHGCVSYDGCSVPTRFCNFGAGQGNPFNTSLRGHYPTSKDPGQSASWVPAEAWSFISQF